MVAVIHDNIMGILRDMDDAVDYRKFEQLQARMYPDYKEKFVKAHP